MLLIVSNVEDKIVPCFFGNFDWLFPWSKLVWNQIFSSYFTCLGWANFFSFLTAENFIDWWIRSFVLSYALINSICDLHYLPSSVRSLCSGEKCLGIKPGWLQVDLPLISLYLAVNFAVVDFRINFLQDSNSGHMIDVMSLWPQKALIKGNYLAPLKQKWSDPYSPYIILHFMNVIKKYLNGGLADS